MIIFIPTYGRVDSQKTFEGLPKKYKKRTVFVVRPEEAETIGRKYGSQCKDILICGKKGVARARQAAVKSSKDDRIIMLDDDLRFCRRTEDWEFEVNSYLPTAQRSDVGYAMDWIYDELKLYDMVGLGARGGNQSQKRRWTNENYRIMRSFGVRCSAMAKLSVRFDDYYYWEDFHIAMTLLEHGRPNVVSMDIVTDALTNKFGGVVRVPRKMWGQARKFVEEHPHAKIKEKVFKWGREVITGPDLRVDWKKSFGSKLERSDNSD